MHPAFSVILFTTLCGMGQGLFVALYGAEVFAAADWGPMPTHHFIVGGAIISVVLSTGGLLASFFHLGHPERAWRSAAMWRTSWLSREVIVLPAFIGMTLLYGLAHFLQMDTAITATLGGIAFAIAIALWVCTGMIYACIRFLQEWASPLTVINYFLLGSASGFTLATAYSAFAGMEFTWAFGQGAVIFTALAFLTRWASLVRNSRLKPTSTLQTAIGVRHPRIQQKTQGSMGGSFNTREFFHGKTRAFLRSVKWIFLILVFPVPVILIALGLTSASGVVLVLAIALQYAGLLFERWFFFAQANHPQNLYYQTIS